MSIAARSRRLSSSIKIRRRAALKRPSRARHIFWISLAALYSLARSSRMLRAMAERYRARFARQAFWMRVAMRISYSFCLSQRRYAALRRPTMPRYAASM